LQLLGEHPIERVEEAVATCLRRDELHAERIAAETRRLSGLATPAPATPLSQFQVPRPDLGCFDQLLSQGATVDGR
jgi:hypothetical protein